MIRKPILQLNLQRRREKECSLKQKKILMPVRPSSSAPASSPFPESDPPRYVLGTSLELVNYDQLRDRCCASAREGRRVAIDFCNTQTITMRRLEPHFREMTREIDCFIPDGMPLVWCLNLSGAGLSDRVYGPTFMRRCLREMPPSLTHFLIGGSEDCVDRLRRIFFNREDGRSNLCGWYTGPCFADGSLPEGRNEELIETINRLSPDFIWVGLGTPKQQAWIHLNKGRIRRGIILGVGFAFDVNAGTKPDAPAWIQPLGLTWLFRLASEPRRLLGRYLRYNSLFLYCLLWDGLRGRLFKPPKPLV